MELILAIDPGRDKTGYAYVAEDGSAVTYGILATGGLLGALQEEMLAHPERRLTAVVCGNGTHHQAVVAILQPWVEQLGIPLVLQDEYNTTVEGRARYWQEFPPTGWRRWVPTSWLTPPRPVDDLTAWVIGARYVQERGRYNGGSDTV